MGIIYTKIVYIGQDLNDVEYRLVELRDYYKDAGIVVDDKTDDLIKTAMNYLISAESVLQELQDREEANEN